MEPEPRFRTAARRTVPPGAPASPQRLWGEYDKFQLQETEMEHLRRRLGPLPEKICCLPVAYLGPTLES